MINGITEAMHRNKLTPFSSNFEKKVKINKPKEMALSHDKFWPRRAPKQELQSFQS